MINYCSCSAWCGVVSGVGQRCKLQRQRHKLALQESAEGHFKTYMSVHNEPMPLLATMHIACSALLCTVDCVTLFGEVHP
jgi:hypothetical protein